ncbi:MAG: DUF4350 domain-containing protein [Cocleimonas sp.]
MDKKTGLLITLLLGLIVAYTAYSFYSSHEYKEVTERSGLLSEARRNPLYASRLFLKRMGIPAVSKNTVQDMGGFPDTDTVMVIVSSRSSFSENHTDELLDWVEEGGHLIARSVEDWNYARKEKSDDINNDDNKRYSGKKNKGARDPLQRLLGISTEKAITFEYNPDKDSDEVTEDEDSEGDNSGYDESIFGKILTFLSTSADDRASHIITLDGVNKPLEVQTNGFKPLKVNRAHQDQSELVKIKNDTFMVRQKVGEGMVTLVTDFRFIKNYHLEKSDHAELFWHLVHGQNQSLDKPSKVWLIHNDEMPSLWALLWRHAWTLILTLGLMFLTWMLMVSRRFGPLIPKQEDDRRSLKEHISSSGHYYWKHHKKQKLIDSARHALMQRLTQVHPGWAQRGKDEQIQLLATQAKLTPKAVEKLLYAQDIEQADEFTSLVRQLENIRKSI